MKLDTGFTRIAGAGVPMLHLRTRNDVATEKYQKDSRHLLAQARGELAQGDVRQASEKGWGAAAQIVKAVAETRGWVHGGHRQLHLAIRRLDQETGDPEITRLFQIANSLHFNFYEDVQEAAAVAQALDDVGLLLDKLEPMLAP